MTLQARDLPAARQAGEDCRANSSRLNTAGISRAAIESLAENTSDGVTAPLFWGSVWFACVVVYKAINTADL